MTSLVAASSSTSAFDQPGTLGFLVVFGMGLVLYFVFRSMSRHLRKVNAAARAEAAAQEAADQQPADQQAGLTDSDASRLPSQNGSARRT